MSCAPRAQLELAHLYEIGRITRGASDVLGVLAPALGLAVSAAPFAAVVAYALDLTWTRDPFDRSSPPTRLLMEPDCSPPTSRSSPTVRPPSGSRWALPDLTGCPSDTERGGITGFSVARIA